MEEEEGVEEAVVTDKEEESVGQKEAGGGHEHSFLCRTCSARSAKYWTTGRKRGRGSSSSAGISPAKAR